MHLRQPLLERFSDRSAAEIRQVLVASILADYADADPAYLSDELLASVVEEASKKQYPVLVPLVKKSGTRLVDRLRNCLADRALLVNQPEVEQQVDRQANAAETLAVLDRPEELWPRLKHTADPRLRTRLIERLAPPRFTSRALLERLAREQEGSIRQAILIGLGSGFTGLPEPERARVEKTLLALYAADPDPGVHGAAEWVLRKWGKGAQASAALSRLAGKPAGGKGWFVTPNRHTMIVVRRPGRFVVGSPDDEPGRDPFKEGRHEVTIDYSFAVSAHELTYTQFREYRHDAYRNQAVTPSEECPVSYVAWASVAGYCNWLTDREGLGAQEHCYVTVPSDPRRLKVPDDVTRKHGYRLLTDHEWEYVARADTSTSRFYGNIEPGLEQYAWYSVNSGGHIWPVGLLRPSPLGLFDIYGNVVEYCEYARPAQTAEMAPGRGGDYRSMSRYLRAAMNIEVQRGEGYSFLGCRIAKTLPEQ